MKYNSDIHHRKSIRLQRYDYSSKGVYFATICTQNRECLFGEIVNGDIVLNEYGKIAVNYCNELPRHFNNVELDYFVIMPNHAHIIIIVGAGSSRPNVCPSRPNIETIRPNVCSSRPNVTADHDHKNLGQQNDMGREENVKDIGREDPAPALGKIVGYFKYGTTKQINALRNMGIEKIWQRNYYEHIIRDENDLNRIREYIVNNPSKWNEDKYYINQGREDPAPACPLL